VAWLIHGTWSDKETWTKDFRSYLEGVLDESITRLSWSGKNKVPAREEAAKDITERIYKYYLSNSKEPIRLVGHSHGGNVAIMVANNLAKLGVHVETLITIATPVREYKLTTEVGQHIQVYNNYDIIQNNGGQMKKSGKARRTFEGALNIEVILPKKDREFYWKLQGVTNHSSMHSNVNVWKKYIEMRLN
jgi:pimeloyl-ACP methyl ester carboxylesterase